jgi:hypothetical protein
MNPLRSLTKPKPSMIYATFWYFAALRQKIFFSRLNGDPFPWTDDPILNTFKFRNVYRICNSPEQYVLTNILRNENFSREEKVKEVLRFRINSHPTQKDSADLEIGSQKINEPGSKTIDRIISAKSFTGLIDALKSEPGITFELAYQVAVDLNYSDFIDLNENEAVYPLEKSVLGIRRCFIDPGEYSDQDIIMMMHDRQEQEFKRLEIEFQSLWGRPLYLSDIENIFSEVEHYIRAGHPTKKYLSESDKFDPAKALFHTEFLFPSKWKMQKK